ncbi:MAG: hypothetical protein LN568_02135 [Rickettsia endosymbiont of Pseudomimeciton antennatum]|nr:hypothetical protein [Rickettsia endosymbiont of Pseudomimeciton antennatum]
MRFSLVKMHYTVPFFGCFLGLFLLQFSITGVNITGIKIKNFDNCILRTVSSIHVYCLCQMLRLIMFKWDQYLLYVIRETLHMTIMLRVIIYLIEHSVGFYELFFSKDGLCYTLPSLFFGFIGYTIDYHYRHKNKKL